MESGGFSDTTGEGSPPAEVAQWQEGLELSSGDLISGKKKSP